MRMDDSAVASPELIFGLVGPLGTDLSMVAQVLADRLAQVRYRAKVHRLSKAMRDLAGIPWSELPGFVKDFV